MSEEVKAEFGEVWPLISEALSKSSADRTPEQKEYVRMYYRFQKRTERTGGRAGRPWSQTMQNYFSAEQLARISATRNIPLGDMDPKDRAIVVLYRNLRGRISWQRSRNPK